VDGLFWFYDEVPDEIKNKVVNGWPTPISAGFTVDKVENGTQKGLFYTHIAVLKDTEDAKCPLGKCGVNVRMESNSPTDYRYEQAQNPDPEAKPAKPAEKVPATVSDDLKAEIAELKRSVREVLERYAPKEQPAVPKPEEKTKTAEVEETKETTPEPPIPKKVIPAGPSTAKKGNLNADGWFEFSTGKK